MNQMDTIVAVKLRRQPLERFQSLQQQQQHQQQRSLPCCPSSSSHGGAETHAKHPQRFARCYSMINDELRLAESSQTTTTSPCCSSTAGGLERYKSSTFNSVIAGRKQQQISTTTEKAGTAGHNTISTADAHRMSLLANDHVYSNSSGTPTTVNNRTSLISTRRNTPLNSRKSLCLTEVRWNDADRSLAATPKKLFSGIFFAHPATSNDGHESPDRNKNSSCKAAGFEAADDGADARASTPLAATAVGTVDRSVCSNDSGYLSSESAKAKRHHRLNNNSYMRGSSVPDHLSWTESSAKPEAISLPADHNKHIRATRTLSTCLTTQAEDEAIYANTAATTTSSSTPARTPLVKAISCYNLSSAAAFAAAAAAGDNVTRTVHDQPATCPPVVARRDTSSTHVVPPPAAINQVQLDEKNSSQLRSTTIAPSPQPTSRPSLQHFSSSNDIVRAPPLSSANVIVVVGEEKVKPETSSTATFADDNDRHCCCSRSASIITSSCDDRQQSQRTILDCKHSNFCADLHFAAPPPICPPKKKRLFVLHSSKSTAAASVVVQPHSSAQLSCPFSTSSTFPSGPTTCDNCCQSNVDAFQTCPITRADQLKQQQQQHFLLLSQHNKKLNDADASCFSRHQRDLSHLTDSTLSSSTSSSAATTTTSSNSFMSSTNSAAAVASAATVTPAAAEADEREEQHTSKHEHALFLKFLRKRNIACTFLLPSANNKTTKNDNNFSSPTAEQQQHTLTTPRPASNLHKSQKSSSKTNFFYDIVDEEQQQQQQQKGVDKNSSCASASSHTPYFASGLVGQTQTVVVENKPEKICNPHVRLRRSSTSKKILNNFNRIRLQHSKSEALAYEQDEEDDETLEKSVDDRLFDVEPTTVKTENNIFACRRRNFCPQPARPKSFCNSSTDNGALSAFTHTDIPLEELNIVTSTTTIGKKQPKKDKDSSLLSRSFEFLSSPSSSSSNQQAAIVDPSSQPSVLFSPESDNPDFSALELQPSNGGERLYENCGQAQIVASPRLPRTHRSSSPSLSNLSVCYDSLDDLLDEARTIMNHFSAASAAAAVENEEEQHTDGQWPAAQQLQSDDGTLVCGEEDENEVEETQSGDDGDTVIVQRTSKTEFEQTQLHMLHELEDRITRHERQHEHEQEQHDNREIVWQRHDGNEFFQTDPAQVKQQLSDTVKPTPLKPKIPRKPTFLRLRAQQQQNIDPSHLQSSPKAATSSSSDSAEEAPTPTRSSLSSANTLATQLLEHANLVAVNLKFEHKNAEDEEEDGEEQEDIAIYSDDMMEHPQACGLPPAHMAQKFRLRLTERDMNRPLSTQQQQQQLGPGQTMHSFEKRTTWTTTKSVVGHCGDDEQNPSAGSARSFSSSSSSSSPIAEDSSYQRERLRQHHAMRPSPLTITNMPITHHRRVNNPLDSSHQYVNTANGTHPSFPTTPTSISNETYGRAVANNVGNTRYFHHTRQDTDTSDDLLPAASSTGGRYVKYKAYDPCELHDAASVAKPIVIYRDSLPLNNNTNASADADNEDDDKPDDIGAEAGVLERSSSKRGSKMGRSLRDSVRSKARRSNMASDGADSTNTVPVSSARDNDESLSSSTEISESVVSGSSSFQQQQPPHIMPIKQQPIILARNHHAKQSHHQQYQNTASNRASSTFSSSALPLYRPYTSSSAAVRPYSTALSGSTMSLSSAAITRVAPVAASSAKKPVPVVERQLSASSGVESTASNNNNNSRYRTPRAHSQHNIHQQQHQHRVQFADMPQIIYAGEQKRQQITTTENSKPSATAAASSSNRTNPVINQDVPAQQNANEVSITAQSKQQQQHIDDVAAVSSSSDSASAAAPQPVSSSSSDRLADESPSTSRSSSSTDDDDAQQQPVPLTRRTTTESVLATDENVAPAVPIKRRPKDFGGSSGAGAGITAAANAGPMRMRNSQSWTSALHTGGGESASTTANDAVRNSVFGTRNAVTPGAGPPLLFPTVGEDAVGLRNNHNHHHPQQQQRLYTSVTSLSTGENNNNTNEPLAAALRAFTPDDLLKTKEHLVERIETKLIVLKEEQTLLNEDISATDRQLVQYAERIRQQATNSTTTFAGNAADQQSHLNTANGQRLYEKFLDYVSEKERVTRLLLAIAARMVRSQQQQCGGGREVEATPSSSEAEKSFGESLRNSSVQQRVLAQHRDAQALKQRVDERGAILMRTLAAEALSAPEMYELHKLLTLRSQLLTDAHDLRVKIVNADEQLTNLKLLSHPTSGVAQLHSMNGSAQPPSSSGVDRRSMFGSVSSLLSVPSSSSPSLLLMATTPQPSSAGSGPAVVHSKTPSSASSNGTLDSLESNHNSATMNGGDKSKFTGNSSSSDGNGFEDNNKHLRQTSNASSSWGAQSTTFSMSTDV